MNIINSVRQKSDNKMMIKVAKLYYEKEFKQERIARKLNISKYKVCRLIKKAKEEGLVKIVIKY